MKNTKKITLCGMVASLAVVIMLTSYFPYLTYAIPAIAGLFMIVPLIECGILWGLGSYFASAVIIFAVGEKQASLLYIMFLGYYPIIKSIIEKLKNHVVEWLLKLICFNAMAIAFYYVITLFMPSLDDFGELGKYGEWVLLSLSNVAFVLYDIGISRIASYYMFTLHDKVKRIIK